MASLNGLRQVAQTTLGGIGDRALWLATGAIALFLALWLGLHSLMSPFYLTTEAQVRNLIVSGVQDATELTSATTTVKATVVLRQVVQALGIPLGDTNLVYEGVGTVRAGIALDGLQVQALDPVQRRIEVKLPPPQIQAVSLDLDRSTTLANYRRWFGQKAGADLYEAAQRQAIAEIRQQACTSSLLTAASHNTTHLITEILTKAGFIEIQVTPTESLGGCGSPNFTTRTAAEAAFLVPNTTQKVRFS